MNWLQNAIIRSYGPMVVAQFLFALSGFLVAKGVPPEVTEWITSESTNLAVMGLLTFASTAAWRLIKRPSPAGMEAAKAVDKGVEKVIPTPPGKPDMIVKPVRVVKKER